VVAQMGRREQEELIKRTKEREGGPERAAGRGVVPKDGSNQRRSHLMRKLIQALLAAAMAVTAFSAAAAEKVDTSKKLTVGFPQIDENQPWRTAESDSFKSEAANYNIDLKYVNAEDSQANQIKALRSFIAQGVDAIILPPRVETGWDPILKEAK